MLAHSSKCNVCNEQPSVFCSGCRTTYYCSTECQKADWKTHKQTCKEKREKHIFDDINKELVDSIQRATNSNSNTPSKRFNSYNVTGQHPIYDAIEQKKDEVCTGSRSFSVIDLESEEQMRNQFGPELQRVLKSQTNFNFDSVYKWIEEKDKTKENENFVVDFPPVGFTPSTQLAVLPEMYHQHNKRIWYVSSIQSVDRALRTGKIEFASKTAFVFCRYDCTNRSVPVLRRP